MASEIPHNIGGLMGQVSADGPAGGSEEAWIEVIQKMDAVYADLVRYQVELEEKNSALEEAQQFIDSVQESMTDVLIVCDIQGQVQQVNRALEELLGRSRRELLGARLVDLFVESSRDMVEEFPQKIRSEILYDCEVSLVGRDGQPAPLAMNCSSRYDHNGRLLGMVLIGRPVGELRKAYQALDSAHRELKQAQQQLVHSEKMASLGRLVAGVAHELNNPISFVFGNMHALKRYGARITRYLEAVHGGSPAGQLDTLRQELKIDRILGDMESLIEGTLEGAERVSDIVQDLRRFSGTQKESSQPFNICPVIRTAVDWVAKAGRSPLEVKLELPEELWVIGSKGAVHQVIVNLAQNAADVMEEQKDALLEISCEQQAGQVRLRVRDHGPGIPENNLMRIFDPFFTTKEVGRGTGLGLYISYGRAADQGGQLQAANHPDGGAEFTLTLRAA